MSRNFELLRQAGWRQEIFEGLPTESAGEESSTTGARRMPLRNDQIASLVRKVFLDAKNSRTHAVMFSGVARGAGCTWTCAQAAKALASSVTGNVCVVDANFVAPALHEHFFAEARSGLSDAVFESKRAKEFAERVGERNLWLVTAGNQGKQAQGLSNGAILQSHLRELKSEFDYLLIDGPTLTSGPQAVSIGRTGDGAILVLKSTGIAPDLLVKAKRQLETARVPLFGVVLNQREPGLPSLLGRLMK